VFTHGSKDLDQVMDAPADARTPLALVALGVGVSYGGVHAVNDLSLQVERGRVVGLIGPNGAGKTTTIDALTGFVAHRGRVIVNGTDVTEAPPHERATQGMMRTWQSLELFEDLTVAENGAIAAVRPSLAGTLRDAFRPSRSGADGADSVARALELLEIAHLADRFPSELSLGQRKLAAVARALCADPEVLLLDEPAAGLDSAESIELGAKLRGLAATGLSILLVDHDMNLVLGLCDHVYVLDFGRLIADGPPEAIRTDARVIEAYLGRSPA